MVTVEDLLNLKELCKLETNELVSVAIERLLEKAFDEDETLELNYIVREHADDLFDHCMSHVTDPDEKIELVREINVLRNKILPKLKGE